MLQLVITIKVVVVMVDMEEAVMVRNLMISEQDLDGVQQAVVL